MAGTGRGYQLSSLVDQSDIKQNLQTGVEYAILAVPAHMYRSLRPQGWAYEVWHSKLRNRVISKVSVQAISGLTSACTDISDISLISVQTALIPEYQSNPGRDPLQ